jgi:hypothetical protein
LQILLNCWHEPTVSEIWKETLVDSETPIEEALTARRWVAPFIAIELAMVKFVVVPVLATAPIAEESFCPAEFPR